MNFDSHFLLLCLQSQNVCQEVMLVGGVGVSKSLVRPAERS